jgi:hypothetical protein
MIHYPRQLHCYWKEENEIRRILKKCELIPNRLMEQSVWTCILKFPWRITGMKSKSRPNEWNEKYWS